MINIILCGGSGTRLWPISRTLMPKQFVKLFKDESLFELTVKRNSKICNEILVVSNEEQYFLALDQTESFNARFLLEPIGRNTAPAIALSCMGLDKDEIVLVTPSDHLIKDAEEYTNVINKAKELSIQNNLVTFGITPDSPETGFGYIEADDLNVKAFHEKPDFYTAKKYLDKGNYLWNSGMFMFKAGVFLEELKKYAPSIYETSKKAYENRKNKNAIIRINRIDMEKIPSNSIDYAVMEKSNKVKIVPSNIGWSDVGSFDALSKELPNDENNNFIISNKIVKTIDINDSIIIDTTDALLISKKGSSQQVKEIVNYLKIQNPKLTKEHSLVHRPWGTYETLIEDNGYKIKRIIVQPNKRLSLQKHFHRNEHWIVVKGTATVTVGNNTKIVRANESTYIRMGEVHRLSNDGKIPIVLIEAQVGEYTGEDDIVRIEDDFERSQL